MVNTAVATKSDDSGQSRTKNIITIINLVFTQDTHIIEVFFIGVLQDSDLYCHSNDFPNHLVYKLARRQHKIDHNTERGQVIYFLFLAISHACRAPRFVPSSVNPVFYVSTHSRSSLAYGSYRGLQWGYLWQSTKNSL